MQCLAIQTLANRAVQIFLNVQFFIHYTSVCYGSSPHWSNNPAVLFPRKHTVSRKQWKCDFSSQTSLMSTDVWRTVNVGV